MGIWSLGQGRSVTDSGGTGVLDPFMCYKLNMNTKMREHFAPRSVRPTSECVQDKTGCACSDLCYLERFGK